MQERQEVQYLNISETDYLPWPEYKVTISSSTQEPERFHLSIDNNIFDFTFDGKPYNCNPTKDIITRVNKWLQSPHKLITRLPNQYFLGGIWRGLHSPLPESTTSLDYGTQVNSEEKPYLNTSIFPCSDYKMYVEDNEPILNIENGDTHIQFSIDKGEIVNIVSRGTNRYAFDYITDNIKKWLDNPSHLNNNLTNREACYSMLKQTKKNT